jgi:hypothetical protein
VGHVIGGDKPLVAEALAVSDPVESEPEIIEAILEADASKPKKGKK